MKLASAYKFIIYKSGNFISPSVKVLFINNKLHSVRDYVIYKS